MRMALWLKIICCALGALGSTPLPAAAETTRETFMESGLQGVWASDCDKPASAENEYSFWYFSPARGATSKSYPGMDRDQDPASLVSGE
jgi:hypothetical protein